MPPEDSAAVVGIEKKISIYIALIMAGIVAIYDISISGNMDATRELSLAFLIFAGARQAAKSFLKK